MNIVLVDYGMGNLKSVQNAFAAVGQQLDRTADSDRVAGADALVLPGVGAFGDGMANLGARGLVEPIRSAVRSGTPLLGLCLGMQLLADRSVEHGDHEGLGLVPGTVDRLRPANASLRVPHVGWNDVAPTDGSTLYEGLEHPTFYFVHSYVFRPDDAGVVNGVFEYGEAFTASVECDNVYGTQYHPEKSQRDGLAVLERFLRAC